MKQAEVKKYILEYLSPNLKQHGFIERKSKNDFIKKEDFGFYRISFGITDYQPEYRIRFALSIRHDSIAETYNLFANKNPKTFNESVTAMCMQGDIINKEEFHYSVFDINDIKKSCDDFMFFMNIKGWDYFNRYKKISSIDIAVNNINTNEFVMIAKRPITRALIGLIVAKNVSNPEYGKLGDYYKELIEKHDNEDKLLLENLIKYLQ